MITFVPVVRLLAEGPVARSAARFLAFQLCLSTSPQALSSSGPRVPPRPPPRHAQLRLSATRRGLQLPDGSSLHVLTPFSWSQRKLPRYLTQSEARAFFAAIKSLRDRALFTLMYNHGLRVGEVLLLSRGDVDLERRRLLVRRLKGGTWSEQVLFTATATVLKKYLAASRCAPASALFPAIGSAQAATDPIAFVVPGSARAWDRHYTTHSLRTRSRHIARRRHVA